MLLLSPQGIESYCFIHPKGITVTHPQGIELYQPLLPPRVLSHAVTHPKGGFALALTPGVVSVLTQGVATLSDSANT